MTNTTTRPATTGLLPHEETSQVYENSTTREHVFGRVIVGDDCRCYDVKLTRGGKRVFRVDFAKRSSAAHSLWIGSVMKFTGEKAARAFYDEKLASLRAWAA